MKKIALPLTLILILTLTACGASTATGEADSATPSDSASALSTQDILLLGAFQLEGTGQAVTANQAAERLRSKIAS